MVDILNLDSLLAQIVLALGAALVFGNGAAIYANFKGKRPQGEEGQFRPARSWFLLAVGVVIGTWGLASLVS